MITQNLSPDQIRTDGSTQPRRSVNPATCREYRERMEAGDQFPPIEVFFDGTDYWLTDGFHRLDAHQGAHPDEPITCQIHQGSLSEARWHSYGVNRTHGLRRTNADKARAVRSALCHPMGAEKSDRQIAEHVGVSHATVIKYRNKLQLSGQIDHSAVRTGKDGRKTNTTNIGRKGGQKAATEVRGWNNHLKPRPRTPTEFREARRNGYTGPPLTTVTLHLPSNHVHNFAFDLLRFFSYGYLQKVFRTVEELHQQRQKEESNE